MQPCTALMSECRGGMPGIAIADSSKRQNNNLSCSTWPRLIAGAFPCPNHRTTLPQVKPRGPRWATHHRKPLPAARPRRAKDGAPQSRIRCRTGGGSQESSSSSRCVPKRSHATPPTPRLCRALSGPPVAPTPRADPRGRGGGGQRRRRPSLANRFFNSRFFHCWQIFISNFGVK